MDPSISERVAATLPEPDLPAPTDIVQTMLMKDGFFVGWKFRHDGGSAVLHTGGRTIEFDDEQGRRLKTVAVESERGAAA
jgi:hypothetical protein